jgi:hypothetical protein
LFLFVGEALSSILKRETDGGRITPLKVARNAPGVSNLLFADDSLLFFKATTEEARVVGSYLKLFQLVSPSKCSLMFSTTCPSATQIEIKSILNVASSTFEEKYLGLPTPEGRMKGDHFQPIMKRFSKRLTRWAEKFSSHGAKDTLIKSGAQALPGYAMGVYKMTLGFCEQYERLIRDFWWGDEQDRRKVHWMAWENMIKPKSKGGSGFRDIHLFNQALLARQAWRLIQKPTSLCARVLKAKYFPYGDILDTVFASDPSPAWQGIEFGLELLKKGINKRIGNGRGTQFVRDQWIPRNEGLKITHIKKNSRRRWVNQLFLPGTKTWNVELLRKLFQEHDVEAIMAINVPEQDTEDRVAWHYETNGNFSVKSAYRLALSMKHQKRDLGSCSSSPDGNRPIWNLIWKSNVPPKIRIFGWRVATDSLATKRNKRRRSLELNDQCIICGNGEDDAHHAVVACTKAVALRQAMRKFWALPVESKFRDSGTDWLQNLLAQADEGMRPRILLLLWRAWHLHNDVIHQDGKARIDESVVFLQYYLVDNHLHVPAMQDLRGKAIVQTHVIRDSTAPNSPDPTWSPPPKGWVKVNN